MTEDDRPIACIARAGGRTIAQGPVTSGVDVRGFIKTDMHGCVSIDAGGVEIVGKPLPSIRKEPSE